MVLFPAIAAGVSGVFAAVLFVRFRRARGLHSLAWAIALSCYAIASLTVAAGMTGGWDATLYRVFWLFGALVNVAWLATGSVALVAKRGVALAVIALATVGSVFALISVIRDPVITTAFLEPGIPSSTEAWGVGSGQTRLVNYYSIVPYFIVVGIAIWTSRTRRGIRPPASRVRGNLLIALGVTVVAVGGFALRRLDDSGAAFSVALAAGVVTMFAGFVLAGRPARYHVEDPGEQPT